MECEYCHSGLPYLHLSGCPECPDPPVVYICTQCNEDIYEGDTYFEIDLKKYCEFCVDRCKKVAECETNHEED